MEYLRITQGLWHVYPGEAHAFAQLLFNEGEGKTYDALASEIHVAVE